jgi:hypothetical protein
VWPLSLTRGRDFFGGESWMGCGGGAPQFEASNSSRSEDAIFWYRSAKLCSGFLMQLRTPAALVDSLREHEY